MMFKKKKYCSVCGVELTSSSPLKDSYGNLFCVEHFKQVYSEQKRDDEIKKLLKD